MNLSSTSGNNADHDAMVRILTFFHRLYMLRLYIDPNDGFQYSPIIKNWLLLNQGDGGGRFNNYGRIPLCLLPNILEHIIMASTPFIFFVNEVLNKINKC
jgi:hypothetical protein